MSPEETAEFATALRQVVEVIRGKRHCQCKGADQDDNLEDVDPCREDQDLQQHRGHSEGGQEDDLGVVIDPRDRFGGEK